MTFVKSLKDRVLEVIPSPPLHPLQFLSEFLFRNLARNHSQHCYLVLLPVHCFYNLLFNTYVYRCCLSQTNILQVLRLPMYLFSGVKFSGLQVKMRSHLHSLVTQPPELVRYNILISALGHLPRPRQSPSILMTSMYIPSTAYISHP